MAELPELIVFIDEMARINKGPLKTLFEEVSEELSRLQDLMD